MTLYLWHLRYYAMNTFNKLFRNEKPIGIGCLLAKCLSKWYITFLFLVVAPHYALTYKSTNIETGKGKLCGTKQSMVCKKYGFIGLFKGAKRVII